MAIRITSATSAEAEKKVGAWLARIEVEVARGGHDRPIAKAAFKAFAELKRRTPKKWTGETRRRWQVKRLKPGEWLVFNPYKVMLFLEEGTGHSTGGYIYPKTKKFLYIPLVKRAANGWKPSFKFGTDYVLARRVRGIAPRHIVANYRKEADALVLNEMKAWLTRLQKG